MHTKLIVIARLCMCKIPLLARTLLAPRCGPRRARSARRYRPESRYRNESRDVRQHTTGLYIIYLYTRYPIVARALGLAREQRNLAYK